MEKNGSKGFILRHARSSAFVVSLLIHAAIILVAVFLIVLNITKKQPVLFEMSQDPQKTEMPHRKPHLAAAQLSVRTPKLSELHNPLPKITSSVSTSLPSIGGVNAGTRYGSGSDLSMISIPEFHPFGDNRGSGNELVGTFYDLKQTTDGEGTGVNEQDCIDIIKGFMSSGWNERRLEKYFKAPRLKYSTSFMMPQMSANAAPKAFGVADQVKPSYWICLYKGQIAAPETGRYRFLGLGDDVLSVRISKRLVLDACWHNKEKRLSNWISKDDNNRTYPLDGEGDSYIEQHSTLVIGDWFHLRKGEAVDMDVLIGELPGSAFSCRLLIEQQGKEYKMVSYSGGMRPVLPVFMTAPIDGKLVDEMKIRSDVATVEGPVFSVLTNTK